MMMKEKTRIVFAGAGSIGTALGHVLAANNDLDITLLTIEKNVATSINQKHINESYFPNVGLNPALKASTDTNIIKTADVLFLAIPSNKVIDYLQANASKIPQETIVVNLAKGFGKDQQTIPECISKILPNTVCSLKGPSFAKELIHYSPTSFTLASEDAGVFVFFDTIFKDSIIFLDYTNDILGVELLSMLKNIYAIIMGVVDAHFNTSNLRFLILTKALNEMRNILIKLGGKKKTIFKYCGIGDFALTALNDLSRNRTLGLLIGKGFFTKEISDKVVLEGKIAVNIFYEKLREESFDTSEIPMMEELYYVFNDHYDINKFVSNILQRDKIIIS